MIDNIHKFYKFIFNSVFFLQWSDKVQLSDIKKMSDLEYLSVKQLKNLLSTNRVDYKGCIERQELLNRVSRLWQEYKQSRQGKVKYINVHIIICFAILDYFEELYTLPFVINELLQTWKNSARKNCVKFVGMLQSNA